MVVAIVGLVTAIAAATMGLATNDIKRVLAFSTISQIGYMAFALGTGAYAAAIFHLFIHGFFKAGLFMAAGNVGHAVHTFDMRRMGGLRHKLPWTYRLTVVCGLSLAALFPFSGFWSKDEILTAGFENGWAVGSVLLLVVSVLTALYTFRMILLTFHGRPRDAAAEVAPGGEDLRGRPHWTVLTALLPIGFVAICSVVLAYLINPVWHGIGAIAKHGFSAFITGNEAVFASHDAVVAAGGEPEFSWVVAPLSILSSLAGLGLAYLLYGRLRDRWRVARAIRLRAMDVRGVARLQAAATRQYYINELYEDVITRRVTYRTVVRFLSLMEANLIDASSRMVASFTNSVARSVASFQSGLIPIYAATMVVGILVALLVYFLWGVGD